MPPKGRASKTKAASVMKMNFAAPAASQGSEPPNVDEMPENRGILWGKAKEEFSNLGVDLFAQNVDMNLLFGDLHGAALLDQIYRVYGDGVWDVPWYLDGVVEHYGKPACPGTTPTQRIDFFSNWKLARLT